MKIWELINHIESDTGFDEEASKDALLSTVESVAVHLTEPERVDFAAQLPMELGDLALAVGPTERTAHQDLLEQVMEQRHVDQPTALLGLQAAWQALKDAITPGEIEHIESQLPMKALGYLG